MFAPCYLDHNSTTPPDPAMIEGMLPWLTGRFGNASSRHDYGRAARAAIDTARQQVAAAVGAHPTEVIFVSGGSEANNQFIAGCTAGRRQGRLAVSAIEHPCVMRPAERLARQGWQLTKIPVDSDGRVSKADFLSCLEARPSLVSVMSANNETGVVQEVAELASHARSAGAIFHSDAIQALGKLPIDFREWNRGGVDAISISAHKINGPKGAAALIVDKRLELEPLIAGGGQERGLRSGTENVPAIVGFGIACEVAVTGLSEYAQRLSTLRSQLEHGLHRLGATIFGRSASRLPNTVFFALPDLDGETLVAKLDRAGFAVASGAACSSVNPEPSHVLSAMGVPAALARGAVRVSLGRGNDEQQVARFLVALQKTMENLKQLAAVAV